MSETPGTARTKGTGLEIALWCLLGAWVGWIVCSIAALTGAAGGWPPYAGVYDVILLALTGDSTVVWAVWGSRVFGATMVLIVVGLASWYVFLRRPDERRGDAAA
ncbi:hypothetical protein [Microbacterium sp. 22242]|uniref:hypothetical protein n=1 Tax=Microbacterium sp. 22242 TaxID=3453896 RepID=UPI003F8656D9